MHGQIADDNQKAIFSEFRRLASLSFEEGQKEAKQKDVMQQLPQLFNEEQLTEVLLQYFICFCTVDEEKEKEKEEKAAAQQIANTLIQQIGDSGSVEAYMFEDGPAKDGVVMDHETAAEKAARAADFEASQLQMYANVKVYGQPEPEEGEYANDSVARGSGKGSAAAPTLEDVLRRDKQLKNPPSKVQKELKGDIAKVWWHSGGRQ